MCSVWCFFNFYITYHGSRGLPIEEESGGSGCECNRGREGEAEEEQESSVPGTKEKGNRRGLTGCLGWLVASSALLHWHHWSVTLCVMCLISKWVWRSREHNGAFITLRVCSFLCKTHMWSFCFLLTPGTLSFESASLTL